MHYRAIGVMSGTSMDGLDVVLCDFHSKDSHVDFNLLAASTFAFPLDLTDRLSTARRLNSFSLQELHLELGTFIGNQINLLLQEAKVSADSVDFIGSHGHTIFHQPDKRITLQIGCGQEIARLTGIKTINNFREKDIRLGGQGAPLVPVGDRDLFAQKYQCDAFLNLGGFANISVLTKGNMIAFDIGPCNLVFNALAKILGHQYDPEGAIGRQGKVNNDLLEKLAKIPFFSQEHPKSLGTEWLDQSFLSILNQNSDSPQNKLRTVNQFLANLVDSETRKLKIQRILATGGGAKNEFLIRLMREKCEAEIILPEPKIIDFKEALVFAYLGMLFLQNKHNCLKEVTGACQDSVGGVCYFP